MRPPRPSLPRPSLLPRGGGLRPAHLLRRLGALPNPMRLPPRRPAPPQSIAGVHTRRSAPERARGVAVGPSCDRREEGGNAGGGSRLPGDGETDRKHQTGVGERGGGELSRPEEGPRRGAAGGWGGRRRGRRVHASGARLAFSTLAQPPRLLLQCQNLVFKLMPALPKSSRVAVAGANAWRSRMGAYLWGCLSNHRGWLSLSLASRCGWSTCVDRRASRARCRRSQATPSYGYVRRTTSSASRPSRVRRIRRMHAAARGGSCPQLKRFVFALTTRGSPFQCACARDSSQPKEWEHVGHRAEWLRRSIQKKRLHRLFVPSFPPRPLLPCPSSPLPPHRQAASLDRRESRVHHTGLPSSRSLLPSLSPSRPFLSLPSPALSIFPHLPSPQKRVFSLQAF